MKQTLSTLVMLLCAGLASAQIVPSMVNPSGTPLELVSTKSTLDDFLHTVTVFNNSSRPIKYFQLGLIMSVPEGCGAKQVFAEERLLRKDQLVIAPAAYVDLHNYALSPESVRQFSVANSARAVLSQLAIVHVEYADGTVWDLRRTGKIYDDAQLAANVKLQCVNSAKVTAATGKNGS